MGLDQRSSAGKQSVGCVGGNDHHVHTLEHAFSVLLHKVVHSPKSQGRDKFAVSTDAAFFNTSTAEHPLVVGVHNFSKVVIGHDLAGDIRSECSQPYRVW